MLVSELSGRLRPRPTRLWARTAAAAPLLLLLLASCFRGRLPPRELYRLRLPENADTSPAVDHDGRALAPGSVAILPYLAPGLYGGRAIVYRVGETEYGTYSNREWAVPLPVMLGMITEDLFRSHPLTSETPIFDPPSPHSHAYIWRGIVRELEEVDRGKQVFASVRLDARLVRAADDSLIWTGSTHLERVVPEGTMPAIVTMLSQLSADAVTQLLDSAREALPAPAASAARAKPPGLGQLR